MDFKMKRTGDFYMFKKRVIIKGKSVQNVGYRLFLLDEAESEEISNLYIKNMKDKFTVEVYIGDDNEEKVNNFIHFVQNNFPDSANVDTIVDDGLWKRNIMTIEVFSRSLSAHQLSKIANVGLLMLGKQDIMIGKQDIMIDKQDIMIGKQDIMIDKQDIMIEKQDIMIGKQEETISELKNLREDLIAYMNTRFSAIEKDVSKIKTMLHIQ